MSKSKIRLKDVTLEYSSDGSCGIWPWKRAYSRRPPPRIVLQDICLEIMAGEFTSILGHSGCGKSTLLKIVAGFSRPTRGTVWIDDCLVTGPQGDHVFVFQEGALFPWLTIQENICLALKSIRNIGERREKAQYYLELVGLEGVEHHYSHMLSGGMRQRAEIARALAAQPDILLMDEPFSGLDYLTRLYLREEMLNLQALLPTTTILFVTHDIDEALQLSNRLIILSEPPAQVKCCRTIRIPHPRVLTSSDLGEMRSLIYHHLGVHTAI